jgi:predicted nicotinamide N-methyase
VTLAAPAALIEELERRFVVETETVTVGAHTVELIRPRSAEELISEDDFARDERLPYWAALWPSAQLLAARVVEERGDGRSLLELGCGLGLVTIAAMRAGFAVLATDYYDDALRFTRANTWRALGREPETRPVDWRELPGDLGTFDRVVAADVLYERPYGELVADVLARTLAPDGLALVADPGRVAVEAFLAACGERGLEVREREERPYAAGKVRQTIRIYVIARLAV